MNKFSLVVSDLLWLSVRRSKESSHHVLHTAVHGGEHVSKHAAADAAGGVVHLGDDGWVVVAQNGLDAAVLDPYLVVDHVVDLAEQVGQALWHPRHLGHGAQGDGEAAVAKVEDGARSTGGRDFALPAASVGA